MLNISTAKKVVPEFPSSQFGMKIFEEFEKGEQIIWTHV